MNQTFDLQRLPYFRRVNCIWLDTQILKKDSMIDMEAEQFKCLESILTSDCHYGIFGIYALIGSMQKSL